MTSIPISSIPIFANLETAVKKGEALNSDNIRALRLLKFILPPEDVKKSILIAEAEKLIPN